MDRRISKASRAELIDRFRLEYHKAGKHRKTEILDSIISSTGLNRKYAVWVLGKPKSGAKKTRRKRPSRFRSILPALRRIWEASDHDCGKRLKAVLPLYLALMTRHGSLTPLQDEEIDLLLSISASSIDRLLAPDRQALQLKGISTTRPGSMLKHDIPFRTFADWDDHRPGFFEADLVAFCTEDAHGDYLFSLTMTDIESGWVALGAMPGRSRLACTEILDEAAARIPFPTQEQLALFRQALLLIETYQNFFQPSFKLLEKHREGALLHRRFLPPRTPLQSVLESSLITEEVKATLLARLESLDPADLLSRIRAAVAKLRRTL